MGLDAEKRVGGKRSLRIFQDFFCAEKRNVPGTVTETFEYATKLIRQEAPAVTGPLEELVSVIEALFTVQVALRR